MDPEWWVVFRTDALGNNYVAANGLREHVAKMLVESWMKNAGTSKYFTDSHTAAGYSDLLKKYNIPQ